MKVMENLLLRNFNWLQYFSARLLMQMERKLSFGLLLYYG